MLNRQQKPLSDADNREVCYRCRKAQIMCYCAAVRSFSSDPEFVILIHPKETRKAINTGRMAFLNIRNSRLVEGRDFTNDPVLNAILQDPARRCFLLFPGPGAIDITEVPAAIPLDGRRDVFIILDATWAMAKKMYRLSGNLQTIPQVMFTPMSPSEFLIRQQPGFNCYSTIETIHHIIEVRGTQPQGEHHHLLTLFRDMVQKQIDFENAP